MRWIAWLCGLLMAVQATAQKNDFKTFFKEGRDLFEQKQFDAALPKLKEAYRLEPEAQRYKLEGTFFADYLPRYQIALCYEGLGSDLDAAEWIDKSKEALEVNVLKRRNETADYHAAADRILGKAKDYRAKLAARYDTALKQADDLLAGNRFEEAGKAYEALKGIDPSRSDADLGLSRIKQSRDNYLKGLVLDARTALVGKDFPRAAGVLDSIEKVDSFHPDLPILRRELEAARKAATSAVAENIKPDLKPDIKKDPDPPPRKDPVTTNPRENPDPDRERQNAEAAAKKLQEQRRATMREALLATLKYYRQGEPEKALAQIKKISLEEGREWGSYHWLKGVYALTTYRYGGGADEDLKREARVAMAEVRLIMPDFKPDSDLYPSYILDFFNNGR